MIRTNTELYEQMANPLICKHASTSQRPYLPLKLDEVHSLDAGIGVALFSEFL